MHRQVGQYDDAATDKVLQLEHHAGFKNWADELWKLATTMGVRRIFPGGKRRQIAYPFHVGEDAMQIDGHKTLHRCHTQCFLRRSDGPKLSLKFLSQKYSRNRCITTTKIH